MVRLEQLDHIALMVRDPRRSMEWYQSVLGLERRHQDVWGDDPIMMCAGSTCVALFPLKAAKPALPPDVSATAVMNHFAFRAGHAGFLEAQAELKRHGIPFDFQDHQIAHSIYFRDPDGHRLEITTCDLPGKE